MATRSFVTLAVVLSFVLALPIATQADNTWGTYHWARKSNPFTHLVVDSVTADWDIELDDTLYAWPASSEWSASTVLTLYYVRRRVQEDTQALQDGQRLNTGV